MREYFRWLCRIIRVDEQTLYWEDVLRALLHTEFVAVMDRDNNRIDDALELRREFGGYVRGPVSVLEVLIALARRGETEIMHDPDLGDRTAQWFWTMIYNLGLDEFAYPGSLNAPNNDLKFMKIMENFIERGYRRDGKGGLFVDNSGTINMRGTEIWDQMCYYFDEFF